VDLINFNDNNYPLFQTSENLSKFAVPRTLHFCKGKRYNIGFCKEEWKLPNATGIDLNNSFMVVCTS
jgi:hypothetical protein